MGGRGQEGKYSKDKISKDCCIFQSANNKTCNVFSETFEAEITYHTQPGFCITDESTSALISFQNYHLLPIILSLNEASAAINYHKNHKLSRID